MQNSLRLEVRFLEIMTAEAIYLEIDKAGCEIAIRICAASLISAILPSSTRMSIAFPDWGSMPVIVFIALQERLPDSGAQRPTAHRDKSYSSCAS